jgi:hypothetical protein
MFIRHFFFIFFLIFITDAVSQTKHLHFLMKDAPIKRKKYSLFAKPSYQKVNNHFFKYESADQKHGLYFRSIISGRVDNFLNSQGIIMNMGTNAIPLNQQNNVSRTWLYMAGSVLEAKIDDDIHIYFQPDFGQEQYRIFDANVNLNYYRSFSVMAGLQTSLISGFEPLAFNYLGFTSNMAPWKEIAIKLFGEIGPSLLTPYIYENDRGINSWLYYELAITNGAPDASFPGVIPFSVNSAFNLYKINIFNTGNKAFEGRFFFNPFIFEENHLFQHLGIGFAGSAMTASNQIGLPAYLSIAKNVIFQFNNGDDYYSIAQGRRNRIHPQFQWQYKNLGIVGDYIISSQQLSNRFNSSIFQYPTIQQINHAGQALILWNLTGENYSWNSMYKPHENFRPFDKVRIGAFQLGFRFSALNLDPNIFNYFDINSQGRTIYKYSDPRTSIQKAKAYGLVLNWLWNENFKLSTEFSYTQFKGGCSTGALSSPIHPGCLTAPYQYITQAGSEVLDRPSEIVLFQQASILF